MSIFHNNGLIGASGQGGGAGGYSISRSLRFNSSDSAYLSRTPASAGNRRTFTWSGWVKRSALSVSGDANSRSCLFSAYNNGSDYFFFYFSHSPVDTLVVETFSGTTAVYRDPSAWMHVVLAIDTTAATAADRMKLYVNGVLQAISTPAFTLNQNLPVNLNGAVHNIGSGYYGAPGLYFSGYLADIHFIDGQALTPSSFTEVSATTGQLIPKAYTGSYGTNGFHLEFADNSSNTATTLGKDTSGNSNNWTPNNLSVTAGAGNDSLVDTPTSYGTDTGVGGEVRGNYCTLNPLDIIVGNGVSSVNGNLDVTLANASIKGTVAIPVAGKWYFEVTITRLYSSAFGGNIGIVKNGTSSWSGVYPTTGVDAPGIYKNSSRVEAITGVAVNDIFGVAVNMDSMTLQIYKNNTAFGSSVSIDAATYLPYITGNGNNTGDGGQFVANFGQRAFAYTAPSGFKALCDTNLPSPLIAKPNTVMDVLTWTGNGVNGRAITGLNFSPDFVWIKNRGNLSENSLFDTVRGAAKTLYSNQTAAELATSDFGHVSSFDANGFTLANGASSPYPNLATNWNGSGIVGWAWDAGTSTVSNTAGSITSSVRANATAGFSIVTLNAATGTYGHGLGVAPQFIISRARNRTSGWLIYHSSATSVNQYLAFDTNSVQSAPNLWGSITSTTIGMNLGVGFLGGDTVISYCFAPVVGYSSFGSYTGNGSTDGPFVYTGFRPRYIMVKSSSVGGSPGYDWIIHDTARSTYNLSDTQLIANSSVSENQDSSGASTAGFGWDILSNGFKIRTSTAGRNQSGQTYIYCAWAESPFNYSRAR